MTKKVFRVKGHDLEELNYSSGMDVANGDVYGFDDPEARIIWIWVGSKSSVEESTVAAWFINKIDQERGGVPEVLTIDEGSEPMLFRENWTINVVEDDTPGFLKKAELDLVEYKLYRVFTEVETEMHDETKHEEVDISRKSLTSGDVYVLDGNDVIYCWIGKGSNLEEKISGQKLMQTIDAERNYTPLQYTIYEGDNDNWEESFYELLDKIESMDPEERKAVSVEDQRELEYVAQDAISAEEHKRAVDQNYQSTDPDKIPERVVQAGSDEHKKMVSGSAVNPDELPKQGTVAARLAAIKARSDGDQSSEDKTVPETKQATPISDEVKKDAPVEEEKKQMSSAPAPTISTPISSRQTETREVVKENTASVQESTQSPQTQSTSEEVSKTYGGAPTPEISDLASGAPGAEVKTEQEMDLSNVKNDCVAVAMHYTVWSVGKNCSVCGMTKTDCPNNENHESIISAGNKCDICFAEE